MRKFVNFCEVLLQQRLLLAYLTAVRENSRNYFIVTSFRTIEN